MRETQESNSATENPEPLAARCRRLSNISMLCHPVCPSPFSTWKRSGSPTEKQPIIASLDLAFAKPRLAPASGTAEPS